MSDVQFLDLGASVEEPRSETDDATRVSERGSRRSLSEDRPLRVAECLVSHRVSLKLYPEFDDDACRRVIAAAVNAPAH